MSFIPKAQEIYRHFKGNLYQIVAVATHTETDEELVIYQAMYGDFKIYARPLSMFTGKVDKEKYPEATQEYRFELQGRVGAYTEPETPEHVDCVNKEIAEDSLQENQQKKASVPEEKTVTEPLKIQETQKDVAGKEQTVENAEAVSSQAQSESVAEEAPQIDPMVMEFLDAGSHEERLNILAALHHRITDAMLFTMAIASDIELSDGTTEEKYEELKNCLLMLDKYEIQRIK